MTTSAPDQNTTAQEVPSRPAAKHAWLMWLALALAFAAWVTVMTAGGNISLAIGIAAVIAGVFAIAKTHGALRKISITATIASAVLVVVIAAFLIGIKIFLAE